MAKNKQYIRQKGEPGGFRKTSKEEQEDIERYGDDETLVDIVEVKEEVQDFFEKNQTLLIGTIALLVLALGGYLAYKYGYQAPRETAGIEAMYKAETQFRRDSFALALENPGAGFDGFLDIIDNYGGTKAANLATYYAGVSYLNLGKYDVAIEYLKDYDANDDVTPITKFGAMGDAYAELGDLDAAESNYKKAVNSENDFLTPYYLNKLAMLMLNKGDNAAALKYFTTIKDNYPKAAEAKSAEKYAIKLKS